MHLGDNHEAEFLHKVPFKVTDKLKYLGVTLPKDPKLILKLNFHIKAEKLKADIGKWRTLPLSMVGRINTIKMVSLARVLYLFQNLLIFLTKSFFKLIDSIILPFIWGFKSPKTHLQKPREKGGFGLPYFQHYYWAANLRALAYWSEGYSLEISTSTPAWVAIEKNNVKDSLVPALLFATPRLPNTKVEKNDY